LIYNIEFSGEELSILKMMSNHAQMWMHNKEKKKTQPSAQKGKSRHVPRRR